MTAKVAAPRPYGPIKEIAPGLKVGSYQETAKIVIKPWGHEYWIHNESAPYNYKLFIVRKGEETSLMSHRQKIETYFILAGEGVLWYRQDATSPNETLQFKAGTIVQIEPGAIHGAIATESDCVILEATTPDPQSIDVIRHADKAGRSDGFIPSEHA